MKRKRTIAEIKSSIPVGNYDHDFIMSNPIPAQCEKCKRHFIDGEIVKVWDYAKNEPKTIVCNEAIRAPSLINCFCFYCGVQTASD